MRRFYPGITLFKLTGAILVLVAHALFIPSITAMELPPFASFLMLEGRIVVPCFYVVSGFLLYKGWSHAENSASYVRRYLLRIAAVYAVFCLLFAFEFNMPALLQGGFGLSNLFLQAKILLMAVFLNGPLIQLWFIPPLLFGAAASYWMLSRFKPGTIVTGLAAAYLVVQLVSGSLLGITNAAIAGAGEGNWAAASSLLGYAVLGATRYVGFGFTFVMMGVLFAKYEHRLLQLNVRGIVAGAIALTIAETAFLIAYAPWTDAYKLTIAMIPNTLLLFYGVLRIRSSAITVRHRMLNLFSIVTFVAHIPFMRLNAWLFGWAGSMELALWQQALQTLLTFAECAALTMLLHRRRTAAKTSEPPTAWAGTEAAAGLSQAAALRSAASPPQAPPLRSEQPSLASAAKARSELTSSPPG